MGLLDSLRSGFQNLGFNRQQGGSFSDSGRGSGQRNEAPRSNTDTIQQFVNQGLADPKDYPEIYGDLGDFNLDDFRPGGDQFQDFGASSGPSVEELTERYLAEAKNLINPIVKQFEEAQARAKKFDEDNPFIFDEVLARASAGERFDPFYEAELGDFIAGVNNKRNRTREDEKSLQKELDISTETAVGRQKRIIDDAIQSSGEGFAGAGLFFSGKREKAGGRISTEGELDVEDIRRSGAFQKKGSQNRESRTLEDLDLGSETFNRKLGAEKETALSTDVAKQRREKLTERELARQNVIGSPLTSGQSSLNLFNLS